MRTRFSLFFVLSGISAVISIAACASVIGADFDRNSVDGGAPSDSDGAPASNTDGATPAKDGGSTSIKDAGTTVVVDANIPTTPPAIDGGTYAAAQATLNTYRFPGPTTLNSTGYCTANRFIWKDQDGALHSWKPTDQSQIDYASQQPTTSVYFPGDSYLAVDTSDFKSIQVYDATQANSLLATLPYQFVPIGADDGVLLDEAVGTGTSQTTNVQEWVAASGSTVDITSTTIPTAQPPSSYGLNQLVIPQGVNVPYALYILDTVAKSTTSVTFDGALARYDTLSMAQGLVVSYVRTGAVYAIRLYQNDDDGTRVEVGDEIANLPLVFSDSTPLEHKFEVHIARDGNHLIYASVFGIWSYGLDDGVLTPLQLLGASTESAAVPDIMCVVESPRVLIYRVNGDSVGQVWAVPLSSLLP